MDDQSDPRGSKKPGSRVATRRHDAHHVGPPRTDEVGSANNPFLAATPLSPSELHRFNLSTRPGNAFSTMRAQGIDLSRLPRKCTGSSNPASPVDESKPNIPRKRSGLDYDEELALPMPKPRPRREPPIDENPKKDTENDRRYSHPRLQKKRSMPDTAHVRATPEPGTSGDGKKKSRLEAIKSKLSFKDLRKEAAKDAGTAVPPMTSFDKQSASQRSATGKGITGFSPSIYNFQARPKPVSTTKSSANPITSSVSPTQHNTAPSRIPLAPSGTYAHAHGSMTSSNSSTGQRVDSWGQVKAATERVESKENLATATKGSIPIPTAKHKSDILATRPYPGTSVTKRSPTLPTSPAFDYAPTGDSPPTLRDLTEGSGKVKYLPRGWLDSSSPSTPSPIVKSSCLAPAPSPEGTPSSDPMSNFLPGFEERLEKIGLPLNKPTPPEIMNRSMDTHAKDVVDMLRALHQRADSGISDLNQKLDELSQWINDQLKTQIEGAPDLERTNNELHSRQLEISREIRKFHLDIHLEMGVMDRRMSVVESKLLEEVETEIQSLALSMQELTQKTDEAIERFSAQSVKAAKVAEKQHAKIKEMEDEITELVQKQANRPKIQPCLAPAQLFISGPTTPTSAEPLIKPPEPAKPPECPAPPMRVSPLPRSVTATRSRQREAPMAKGKTGSVFNRSLSIKKGLANVAPSDSDSQSKPRDRVGSGDESKKWNIFGFRRRDTSNESSNSNNGSNKFGWLPSRRSRDGRASDNGSARSVTPPPPIPRNILQNIENNIHAASKVHPAFRNMVQQTVMQDESLSSLSSPSTPTASMPPRLSSRLSRPDSQYMGVITASVAPSLASSHERRGASGELLSPSLYKRTRDSFSHSSKTPNSIRSIEDMRRPLLYGAEEENHDWDRCSLHEAKSTASLR